MIYTSPGVPFSAAVEDADPGLTGTLSVAVYAADGATVVTPATTAGVVEGAPGAYTATLTIVEPGQYLVRWAWGALTADEDVEVGAAPAALTPSVADVAARLPARAVDEFGKRAGTFDETTTVKGTEVEAIIAVTATLALPRLGDVPSRLEPMARELLTIRSAMAVELHFWPEQTEGDQTTYAQLRQEYRDALADYDAAVQGDVGKTPRIKSLRTRTFYTSDDYLAAYGWPPV